MTLDKFCENKITNGIDREMAIAMFQLSVPRPMGVKQAYELAKKAAGLGICADKIRSNITENLAIYRRLNRDYD
jgi:hypothetical protein